MKAFLLTCSVLILVGTSARADRFEISGAALKAILAAGPRPNFLILNGAPPTLTSQSIRKGVAESLLGLGFNVWLNKATVNRCVDYPSSYAQFVPYVKGVPSSFNWSQLQAVSTFAAHASNQSMGGSASITYEAFSLGISHSSASSNHFSSYSSYIDVDKGLIGDTGSLAVPNHDTPIVPSQLAKDAIGPHGSGQQFAQLCGQAFVSRVMFGEHLVGTLDYTTMMNSNAAANSTAVSAAVGGILGGSFSSSSQYSALTQQATINYNVHGGPAADADPAQWISTIRSYGVDGKFSDSNTVVFVETTPYSQIADQRFAGFLDASTFAAGTMKRLSASFMDSIQLLSDLMFAQANVTHFQVAPDVLTKEINTVGKFVDAVGDVYETCSLAVDKATTKSCKDAATALTFPDYISTPTIK